MYWRGGKPKKKFHKQRCKGVLLQIFREENGFTAAVSAALKETSANEALLEERQLIPKGEKNSKSDRHMDNTWIKNLRQNRNLKQARVHSFE